MVSSDKARGLGGEAVPVIHCSRGFADGARSSAPTLILSVVSLFCSAERIMPFIAKMTSITPTFVADETYLRSQQKTHEYSTQGGRKWRVGLSRHREEEDAARVLYQSIELCMYAPHHLTAQIRFVERRCSGHKIDRPELYTVPAYSSGHRQNVTNQRTFPRAMLRSSDIK